MASYKEYMNLTPGQIMSMSRQELATVTTIMQSAANKRIKRMSRKERLVSQAYVAHKNEMVKGKFSVKGKNLNQLRKSYISLKNFLSAKTSTGRGVRKVKEDLRKRLGLRTKLSKKKEDKLWSAYNKFVEMYASDPGNKNKNYSSTQIQKDIVTMVNKGTTEEEILAKLDKTMEELYEERTEEANFDEFMLVSEDSPIK